MTAALLVLGGIGAYVLFVLAVSRYLRHISDAYPQPTAQELLARRQTRPWPTPIETSPKRPPRAGTPGV